VRKNAHFCERKGYTAALRKPEIIDTILTGIGNRSRALVNAIVEVTGRPRSAHSHLWACTWEAAASSVSSVNAAYRGGVQHRQRRGNPKVRCMRKYTTHA